MYKNEAEYLKYESKYFHFNKLLSQGLLLARTKLHKRLWISKGIFQVTEIFRLLEIHTKGVSTHAGKLDS